MAAVSRLRRQPLQAGPVTIHTGDALETLRTLPDGAFQCAVTSPPYYGLRCYGHRGQIGLEETPDAYVSRLVEVFREVRRCLRDDGTLWLNLGDTARRKQLLGIPWRVAFALQADGWLLRSAIVWAKPNAMPAGGATKAAPGNAYEMLFLLARGERHYYDGEAIREPRAPHNIEFERRYANRPGIARKGNPDRNDGGGNLTAGTGGFATGSDTRAARNVWAIPTQPLRGKAHFAPMPSALAERCILAGSAPGDAVLDPFFGAGTTGLVAADLGRSCTGIELNPQYARLARKRIADAIGEARRAPQRRAA